MPYDMMLTCEKRTLYKIGGAYEKRWKEVPVAEAVGTAPGDLRCVHCGGEVRLHHRKVTTTTGPQDHAEHRRRQDSEGCKAGHYFKGEHRRSATPIE